MTQAQVAARVLGVEGVVMDQSQVIKKLPKAELHLHIEGTLEPELMYSLAQRNQVPIKYKSIAEIRNSYNFQNLQSFLDVYYQGASVLQHEQDFFDLGWAYLQRAHQDKVVHSEIFFDPQTHTERGIDFSVVMAGLSRAFEQGRQELGISSHLIMCFLRHLSQDEAFETLKLAEPHLDKIKGVGLDSSEVGHPPAKFKEIFAECGKLGLERVAHAGEEGPPEYIWEALDLLQVKRIDHGVRCLEDEKLVSRLKAERIPLTVCPLSNLKLRVFDRLEDHNLKKLLDADLCASIHSDDPAYFGGYLNQNFSETGQALDLGLEELKTLAKNSFEASFIPEETKQKYYSQIDQL